ncbi:glycosyltransferase family 2 protein [Aliidiomarina sp. Khilg15.8]
MNLTWLEIIYLVLIGYFVLLFGTYAVLNLISLFAVHRHMQEAGNRVIPQNYLPMMPAVSVLVPAYNEESTIVDALQSLLQLDYSEFEIIVINDGSNDNTLQQLLTSFQMQPWPHVYRDKIATEQVRGLYRSSRYPQLWVIDKANGGKADALNAGINLSRYALFCGIDADSVLQRDSLQRVMMPFLEDRDTVAAGGTVRILNGSEIRNGFLRETRLPKTWLPRLQIVEYLRAFLFGRMGWSPLNALLIVSGAFGVFRKTTVIDAGGYQRDTIGEDMELITRIHMMLRRQRKRYRITFVPDPVCWTEAPEDIATLRNQRIRWQQGLLESLWANRKLCCNRRGGLVGWFAYPFMLLFEALGPILELFGYALTLYVIISGELNEAMLIAFLLAAVVLGMLVSIMALLLEEMTFRVYKKPSSILTLLCAAVMENLGYRQINSWWRLRGIWRWLRRKKGAWGDMKRRGSKQ